MGKGSRKRQVKDFIEEHNLEVVVLQETIKDDFTDRELRDFGIKFNKCHCYVILKVL